MTLHARRPPAPKRTPATPVRLDSQAHIWTSRHRTLLPPSLLKPPPQTVTAKAAAFPSRNGKGCRGGAGGAGGPGPALTVPASASLHRLGVAWRGQVGSRAGQHLPALGGVGHRKGTEAREPTPTWALSGPLPKGLHSPDGPVCARRGQSGVRPRLHPRAGLASCWGRANEGHRAARTFCKLGSQLGRSKRGRGCRETGGKAPRSGGRGEGAGARECARPHPSFRARWDLWPRSHDLFVPPAPTPCKDTGRPGSEAP